MSEWEATLRVAGITVRIRSRVGDPSALLPPDLAAFLHDGVPEAWVELAEDEVAQADPLRRFTPPQFRLRSLPEGLAMVKRTGGGEVLGTMRPGRGEARLGLPDLGTAWRVDQEEEGVREALQAFLRAFLQALLLETGGTMLHAAGIELKGWGLAFTGHTRSGKTTLARRFPRHRVLGDDLVAVSPSGEGFLLYGTPWPGREGGPVSYGGVPLRAVFVLRPGEEKGVAACAPAEAVSLLAAEAPRLEMPDEESKLLEVFSSLCAAVPICRLSAGLQDDVMEYVEEFI